MKNMFKSFVFLLAVCVATSCTPGTDYRATSKEFLSDGSWKIHSYYSGQDQTSRYSPYVFTFKTDGSAIAVSGSFSDAGTWGMSHDASRNEVILLQWDHTHPDLSEFNERWTVQFASPGTVSMTSNDGDRVTFQKLN